MYDFESFNMRKMIEIGSDLRRSAEGSASMEEASEEVVDLLRRAFSDPETGESGCALVRLYKTHPFGDLEPVA